MGIIEAKQIKTAVKKDGLQNVKKSAFIYQSCNFLETEKDLIKQRWETEIEQFLDKHIQTMEEKKSYISKLLEGKENELQGVDIELIDKLETQTGKSFNQLTGYKKASQKLSIYQQLLKRIWREEISLILVQIDQTIQKVKQKLKEESPQLTALDCLGEEIKYKAFQIYIKDDAFEIERERYNRKAVQLFERTMSFEKIMNERFGGDQVQQQINRITDQFEQKLQHINSLTLKCPGFC